MATTLGAAERAESRSAGPRGVPRHLRALRAEGIRKPLPRLAASSAITVLGIALLGIALLGIALVGVGGIGAPATAAPPGRSASHSAARTATATARSSATFNCDLIGKEMVAGTPDVAIHTVPAIQSVRLVPDREGLLIVYSFRPGFALAPEGVYFSWSVFIYRHRTDASNAMLAVQLQVQDRGKGWQPSGWSVLASTYYRTQAVAGKIETDKARDEISVYFPPGFTDLQPPFYWYASQEVFRGYLPEQSKTAHQDFNVNGSITNDCPSGVRTGTFSLPYPAKLLAAS